MTVAALPPAQRRFPSPPAARRKQEGNVLTTSADRLQAPRPHPQLASSPARKLGVFAPAQNNARPKPRQRSVRGPKIPIGCDRPNSALPPRGFLLTRLSNAGPAVPDDAPAPGAGIRNRQLKRKVLVSVNSDYQTGCAPCQPRIRRDPAIPNHDPSIREKEFLAAGPIFTSAP